MSRSRRRLGVGVFLVVSAGASAGWFLGAHTAVPPRGTAGADKATSCAKGLLKKLGETAFHGRIYFESVLETVAPDGTVSSTVTHSCRLTCAPNGAVRLDLQPEGKAEPIICCVTPDEAWMIWGSSPSMYRSGFPFQLKADQREEDGWRRQLYFQARQTLQERDRLLLKDLGTAKLHNAELTGNQLAADFEIRRESGTARRVHIEAVRNEVGQFALREVALGPELTMKFLAPYDGAGGPAVASDIRYVAEARRGKRRTRQWTVTGVVPVAPKAAAAAKMLNADCTAPTGRSAAYPHLIGQCLFDPSGKGEPVAWN